MFGVVFSALMGCSFFTTEPISTTTLESTTSALTADSPLTIQLKLIYDSAVSSQAFVGTYEEWLETVRGPQGLPGENGEPVVMQVADGSIQWKYQTAAEWTALIELTALIGPQGASGSEIQLQVADGFIQWKHEDGSTWTDLISLTTLTGASGAAGTNGENPLFQVSGGYLQWKYPGEDAWTNLVELTSLTGPQGLPGSDGQEVVFQVESGYIQWKYRDEIEWRNLCELSMLQGEDAVSPTITINEAGFWVINGVVTE